MHPFIDEVIPRMTDLVRRTGREQELPVPHLPGQLVIRVTEKEARIYTYEPTPSLMEALVRSGRNFCGVYER
jgi:hypothetical protein